MSNNQQAIRQLPAKLDLDAIVAMSPENFGYVSGAHIITVSMIRPRHAYAIIPRQGEPTLVVCSIERSLAEAESWISDLRTYTEFKEHPIDVLAGVLKERGLAEGRVGIDLDYLPQSAHARLIAQLPRLTLVNTTEDIARIRAIKSADEVARLAAATRSTHRAVLDAMRDSRLGDTERAMANRIAKGMMDGGADGTLFLCFASGPRTAQAHAMATDRVPQEGEVIRFDVGASYGPWASDFARTYSSGNPTPLQRETYRKLSEIQEETINAIRPGMTAEALFFFCKEAYEKRQLRFHMPHIGHSFGIELHESPMLRPGETTVLREGMVLNIEPMVFDEAGSCYHLEDLVVVRADGPELLTLGLAPREIPVIGTTVG